MHVAVRRQPVELVLSFHFYVALGMELWLPSYIKKKKTPLPAETSYWLYWLVLCQLDTGWSYHRERSFSWGNASMRSSCKAFFSISDLGGRSPCQWYQLWAGSLGSIREQAEQARGSKPVRNIPPWPLHQLLLPDLLEFQFWLPLVMNSNVEV
jgi:hypothetical protein